MLSKIQGVWRTDKANGYNLKLYISQEKILITYLKIGYHNYPCKYEVVDNDLIIELCEKISFKLKDNKLFFFDDNNKLIEMEYHGEYKPEINATFMRII